MPGGGLFPAACFAGDPYVTALYWPTGTGYAVELTVHNTLPTSSVSYVDLVNGADALNPWGPTGWIIYQDFRRVDWHTPDYQRQVQPGQSLGGFGFALLNPPGTLDWWVLGDTGYSGHATPVLIPEPGSLLAVAAGLGALGLRRRRR